MRVSSLILSHSSRIVPTIAGGSEQAYGGRMRSEHATGERRVRPRRWPHRSGRPGWRRRPVAPWRALQAEARKQGRDATKEAFDGSARAELICGLIGSGRGASAAGGAAGCHAAAGDTGSATGSDGWGVGRGLRSSSCMSLAVTSQRVRDTPVLSVYVREVMRPCT